MATKTKNTGKITQSVFFAAKPEDVFELLMDEGKHAEFTGSPAKISRKEGGAFSTFDGYATGKNIEIVPGKKIVQEWRASDWEKGANSIATFAFSKEKGGTRLAFTQTGVPMKELESIADGWKEYYWKPMKEFLSRQG